MMTFHTSIAEMRVASRRECAHDLWWCCDHSVLSLLEFKTALGTVVAGMSQEDLRLLADHFDVNGTTMGFPLLVLHSTRACVSPSITGVTAVMSDAFSGDGYISYREFLAMVDPTFRL